MGESAILGKQLGEQMEGSGSGQGLKMSCCGSKYCGLTCKNVLPASAGCIFTKKYKELMIFCRMGSKVCVDMAEVSNRTYSVC